MKTTNTLYEIATADKHILISGCTGSGKSVLLNHLIKTRQTAAPPSWAFVDPKKIELYELRNKSNCIGYTDSPDIAAGYMLQLLERTAQRYEAMRFAGFKTYTGTAIILVIDELADLLLSERGNEIKIYLQRLLQIGRAARVFVWAATQSPSRKTLPAEMVINFNLRIGLKQFSAIESKQIVGVNGCETLPPYGAAIVNTGAELFRFNIPPEIVT